MNDGIEQIRPVLNKVRAELMNRPNVIATGIGYKVTGGKRTDRLSIVCSVVKKVSAASLRATDLVPQEVEGVPTDVVATGPVSVFQDRTGRERPAPGGISIAHERVSAGTLGCLVKKAGEIYILSNNHVIANSNDAEQGDAILQPGTADGGDPDEDAIAALSDFVPIYFEESGGGSGGFCRTAEVVTSVLNKVASLFGRRSRFSYYRTQQQSNRVDAAIARPINDELVTPEILEIGEPGGIVEGNLGMDVMKSGRTTGLTTGTIQQIDVSVRVNFGPGRVALFEDQLMAGDMSQPGDSGSVVLDDQKRMVGLLFAGGVGTTLINRIQNVVMELELDMP
jgi:hypothetical protein